MQIQINSLEEIAAAAQTFLASLRQSLPSLTGSEGNSELTECQSAPNDQSRTPLLRTGQVGGGSSTIAFYGSMGAGKTTFIRAICEALGVQEPVTSPTFAIVNEYVINDDLKKVFHFDFYRIKRLEEAYDMGFEDYIYSGHLCLIEWPELIEELLPDTTVRVHITANEYGSRTISW